jgi:hypothetical protein
MLAKDIAEYLEDATIGTVGSSIFVGMMPDAPADCIAVIQSGGESPEMAGPISGQIERPRLIVRVRNTSYASGASKANDVLKALHTAGEVSLSGHRYLFIRAVGSVNQLGRDHENRSLFSLDFVVTKEMD